MGWSAFLLVDILFQLISKNKTAVTFLVDLKCQVNMTKYKGLLNMGAEGI